MSVISKLNGPDDFSDALLGDDLVIIKFSADWCYPCKVLSQAIERLGESDRSGVCFYEVDVEDSEFDDLCSEHNIRNLPTLLFFKHGNLVKRNSGAVNPQMLSEMIKEAKDAVG